MPELKVDTDLKTQVKEYLEKQGYQITEEAKLHGKSGIEHTFDMLAQRDDGFTTYTIAICLANGSDSESEESAIFSFANKAYDTGIRDRVLIAIPGLGEEAKELAKEQRIKVINEDQVESLFGSPRPAAVPAKVEEPFKFENREQLIESLIKLGYRLEENANVRGRSGVEYTFDILAYTDIDQVGHSLGIDFLTDDKEVNLEQVALFDTKAYETGIDDKIIVASPRLSTEAQQFAQHQRIKVFEVADKSAVQPAPTAEKPAGQEVATAEKPVDQEVTTVEKPAKDEKEEAKAEKAEEAKAEKEEAKAEKAEEAKAEKEEAKAEKAEEAKAEKDAQYRHS